MPLLTGILTGREAVQGRVGSRHAQTRKNRQPGRQSQTVVREE